MRDINVNITRAHIRDGVKGSECNCPIALAIKDTLLTENVKVNDSGIYINDRRWEVDKKDLRFIEKFDNGERVRPYSFALPRTNRK